MMMGGSLLLFALLAGVFVIGIPLMLVLGILAAATGFFRRKTLPLAPTQTISRGLVRAANYCSHCGQALEAGWSHCPRCGAPIGESIPPQ